MPREIRGTATIADLMSIKDKAELINGYVVVYPPNGYWHARLASDIVMSLDRHVDILGVGETFTGLLAYALDMPLESGRQSFSPDASYYAFTLPKTLWGPVPGPPTFAVEIRTPDELNAAGDCEYADKRKDYFFAGTLVVWDVDPVAGLVTKYAAADPLTPVVFAAGQAADAEPAVPGWALAIDALFA